MIKVPLVENSILKKQYKYLTSCINNKGQLIDKKLQVPLNFQYYYSSFILSSVLIGNSKELEKVIYYYLSISKEIMKPSNDFNVMLLYFAIFFDNDNSLKNYKTQLLYSIYYKKDKEYFYSNNNFRALRLVGIVFESKVNCVDFSSKINDELKLMDYMYVYSAIAIGYPLDKQEKSPCFSIKK